MILFSQRNYRRNLSATQPEKDKMINGQGCGAVADLRYGSCCMRFNGCEVIAVYNALLWLGRSRRIVDIALYMEKYRWLMGFFGCRPHKIGKILFHFGAENQKSRETEGAKAFIVSFWNKRPFLSSIHTVFCVRTKHGTEVYNSYNKCTEVKIYSDIQQYIGKRKPIAVYAVG